MPFPPKSPFAFGLFVRWLPFIAFSAVIVHYFWFVSSFAMNIPFNDDIYDYLRIVNVIESADSSAVAFQEWFRQYVDHRTNASRLLVYGAYLVEGEVNFRTLTFIANLALLLILGLFYLSVRGDEYRWIFLLVSALLLLNLTSFTLILWSQPAFTYYGVTLYAFACLFTLHKVTLPKFVIAAVLCTLATFTYAAGQIVWLLGLTSLLHQSLVIRSRPFTYPVMWLLVAIVLLLVWRIDFLDPFLVLTSASAGQDLRAAPGLLIDPPFHQALSRYLAWFLIILGSAFTDSSTLVAGAGGVIMVAVLLFVTVKFYKHEDIRLALCCWFVVGCAAAVSVGRAMFMDPVTIFHQRYSFFSVMLMCTLTLLVQVRFKGFRTAAIYVLVVLAGIYSVWTYRHFERPFQAVLKERYGAFNAGEFPVFGRPRPESAAIVREAIAAGIYNPPCRPFPACETPPPRGE
jgi:hypothetical protein